MTLLHHLVLVHSLHFSLTLFLLQLMHHLQALGQVRLYHKGEYLLHMTQQCLERTIEEEEDDEEEEEIMRMGFVKLVKRERGRQ